MNDIDNIIEVDSSQGTGASFMKNDWINADARIPGCCYVRQFCVNTGTLSEPDEEFLTNYFDVFDYESEAPPQFLVWQHTKSFVCVYNENIVNFSVQYQDSYSNDPSTGYPKVVYWPTNSLNSTTVSLSTSTRHWFYLQDVSLPCGSYEYRYIVKNDQYSQEYNLDSGSFIITRRPYDVINTGIEQAAYVTSSGVLLKWDAVNPESGGTTYKLYFGKDPNNLQLIYTGTNNFHELNSMDFSSKYYWQVEAINIYGVSAKSLVYNFQTIGSVAKAYNYPNPFNPAKNENTNIVFDMQDNGFAELSIYTEFGDLCWRKTFDNLNKGTNQMSYDGRDDDGKELFNGTYVCKIKKKYGYGENTDKCRILIIK
ncbi:MAG: hypothetical protein NT145_05225 [Elusimicrobia bacterium]|nr:hypothetical protein [Elusimicrobiota bacterium]